MSTLPFLRAIQMLFRQFWRLLRNLFRRLSRGLRRGLLRRGRRQHRTQAAGFVLPTVAMVMLVVVLLTTAMVLRSFDRSKNASNFRVDRATMQAASPALDRAKAKIEALFNDPKLGGNTPPEDVVAEVFSEKINDYTLGDETPLKLAFDIDGDNVVGEQDRTNGTPAQNIETINTAWKFPVDTDNNGKFDTFTLYAITYRTPPKATVAGLGERYSRERNPLEARTPPLSLSAPGACGTSGSGGAAGAQVSTGEGWYKDVNDSSLRKSFYTYVVNVPITPSDPNNPNNNPLAGLDANQYELFKGGGQGFSALEYQQDRARIPLDNNAVLYQDDLEITPGAGLTLNGRVFTNGNLLLARTFDPIQLFLVSSPASCYYTKENSEIRVGGNLGNGGFTDTGNRNAARVDRFNGAGVQPAVDSSGGGQNTTNTTGGSSLAYNSAAYNHRINFLVEGALARGSHSTDFNGITGIQPEERISIAADPKEVKDRVNERLRQQSLPQNPPTNYTSANYLNAYEIRREELENYFKKRTRRVPYAEVASSDRAAALNTPGVNAASPASALIDPGSGAEPPENDPLRPIAQWMYPVDPTANATSYTGTMNLQLGQLPSTDPELRGGKEWRLGDRIALGNNLPEIIYNQLTAPLRETKTQDVTGQNWLQPNNNSSSGNQKTRETQVTELPDLGAIDRDRFWEQATTELPRSPSDNKGGLRIVTGSGIYLPDDATQLTAGASTVPATPSNGVVPLTDLLPTTLNNRIWPDSMPMARRPAAGTLNTAGAQTGNEVIMDRESDRADNDPNDDRPYLRMRASVVYHWLGTGFTSDANGVQIPKGVYVSKEDNNNTNPIYPEPIACVSSYYDPTDANRSRNRAGLPGNTSGTTATDLQPGDANGASNNGIVYPWNGGTSTGASFSSLFSASFDGRSYGTYYDYQAKLLYPSGRPVNPLLRAALAKMDLSGNLRNANSPLTIAEKSALDSAFCALSILNNEAGFSGSPTIPHGAIREVAFLDNREIKAIDNPSDTRDYDLSIEERQPLEIRATRIDLNALRMTAIGNASAPNPTQRQEYLLPNSGIVYATREDALLDLSDQTGVTLAPASPVNPAGDTKARELLSPTDFVLDYTRRPSAIVLAKGEELNRNDTNNNTDNQNSVTHEKGLIMVSNLPVYIHGNFNVHQQTEFTNNPGTDLTVANNFYGRTGRNPNFACRIDNAAGCTTGDTWRQARVLSDAMTMLSDNFQFGFRTDGDYDLRHNSIEDLTPVDIPTAAATRPYRTIDYICSTGGCNFDLDPPSGTPVTNPLSGVPNPVPSATDLIDETKLLFDLNGDGDIADTAVAETAIRRIPRGLLTKVERRQNGFFDNNFVTSSYFRDSAYSLSGGGTVVGGTALDATIARTPPTGIEPSNPAPNLMSSYFNNFVTPVQRRTSFPEYVMEICRKLPVSECGPNDWVVGYDFNGDGDLDDPVTQGDLEGTTPTPPGVNERVLGADVDFNGNGVNDPLLERNIRASDLVAGTSAAAQLGSGTTFLPALVPSDRRFPRRVAFLRYPYTETVTPPATPRYSINQLVLGAGSSAALGTPVPLGITGGNVSYHSYNAAPLSIPTTTNRFDPEGTGTATPLTAPPERRDNALWFRTTTTTNNNPTANINWGYDGRLSYLRGLPASPAASTTLGVGTDEQPLLVPVVQLQITKRNAPSGEGNFTNLMESNATSRVYETYWLQVADGNTTTAPNTTREKGIVNVVVVSGDSPARPSETNGGLGNYIRFLENWGPGNGSTDTPTTSEIRGGFIQTRRSRYATAPHLPLLLSSNNGIAAESNGIFNYLQVYKTNNSNISSSRGGILAYYTPPQRAWGFDVGLLSQRPDRFSERFTLPSTAPPNEFFRQSDRNDPWVRNLLCAAQPTRIVNPNSTGSRQNIAVTGGYNFGVNGARDGNTAFYRSTVGSDSDQNRGIDYTYAAPPAQRPNCSATANSGSALRYPGT